MSLELNRKHGKTSHNRSLLSRRIPYSHALGSFLLVVFSVAHRLVSKSFPVRSVFHLHLL